MWEAKGTTTKEIAVLTTQSYWGVIGIDASELKSTVKLLLMRQGLVSAVPTRFRVIGSVSTMASSALAMGNTLSRMLSSSGLILIPIVTFSILASVVGINMLSIEMLMSSH
jgi:hypothetical protein